MSGVGQGCRGQHQNFILEFARFTQVVLLTSRGGGVQTATPLFTSGGFFLVFRPVAVVAIRCTSQCEMKFVKYMIYFVFITSGLWITLLSCSCCSACLICNFFYLLWAKINEWMNLRQWWDQDLSTKTEAVTFETKTLGRLQYSARTSKTKTVKILSWDETMSQHFSSFTGD